MSKRQIDGPIIWLYWENSNFLNEPELVSRCRQIYENYENVIILNEITIHDYLDDIVDCSRIEHLAQKVDYYRAKLLYEYGGIWLDFDMILLEDVTYLYYELMNSEHEVMGNYDIIGNSLLFNISFIVFKPNSIIAEKWYKYVEDYIIGTNHISWADLGGKALGKMVKENNFEGKIMPMPKIGFSLGYENKSYELYFSMDNEFIKEKLDFIIQNKTKVITLYGTFMYKIPIIEGCLIDQMFKLRDSYRENFFFRKDFEYFYSKIKNNQPFKYARYNDSEIIALIGKFDDRANCDGHQYFKEMSVDLNNALLDYKYSENYILESGKVWYEQDYLKEYMDKLKCINPELIFLDTCFIDWTHNYEFNNFLSLLELLKSKEIVIVGPKYLLNLNKFFPHFNHIEVPLKNCYLSKNNIIESIKNINSLRDNNIYIISASMATNVIIDNFKNDNKNTYIDWGCIWDTFFVSPEYSYIVKRAKILHNYDALKNVYKNYLI